MSKYLTSFDMLGFWCFFQGIYIYIWVKIFLETPKTPSEKISHRPTIKMHGEFIKFDNKEHNWDSFQDLFHELNILLLIIHCETVIISLWSQLCITKLLYFLSDFRANFSSQKIVQQMCQYIWVITTNHKKK